MKKLKNQISINLPLFSFFLFKNCFCSDPWYEVCVPKDCGDGLSISFPFFINGLQNSSCGYPGYNLTCNNGSSRLQISGNDFIVKQIDRENRQVRLQNAAILANQTESCSSKIRNLTLDPTEFTIDNATTTKLVLISNCSGTFSNDLERYRIRSCAKSREFVMVANDKNLRKVTDGCGGGGEIVETPVELVDGEEGSAVVDGLNYKEVAERGFLLRWFTPDCGTCERSGGRCGFDWLVFQFRCFCLDRPHKVRCLPVSGRKLLPWRSLRWTASGFCCFGRFSRVLGPRTPPSERISEWLGVWTGSQGKTCFGETTFASVLN